MASAANACGDDKAERQRVLLNAMLMTAKGVIPVRIWDISANGAQLRARDPLPAAGDVMFIRGPIAAAARIIWSHERSAGIRFYRSLTADEFDCASRQAHTATVKQVRAA